MTLPDTAKEVLNRYLETNQIPFKFNELIFYRQTYHEVPFEHIEVIREIERLTVCETLFVIFNMTYQTKNYEYEAKFESNNGDLVLKGCKLTFANIMPDENPEDIVKKMEEIGRIVCMLIVSCVKGLSA